MGVRDTFETSSRGCMILLQWEHEYSTLNSSSPILQWELLAHDRFAASWDFNGLQWEYTPMLPGRRPAPPNRFFNGKYTTTSGRICCRIARSGQARTTGASMGTTTNGSCDAQHGQEFADLVALQWENSIQVEAEREILASMGIVFCYPDSTTLWSLQWEYNKQQSNRHRFVYRFFNGKYITTTFGRICCRTEILSSMGVATSRQREMIDLGSVASREFDGTERPHSPTRPVASMGGTTNGSCDGTCIKSMSCITLWVHFRAIDLILVSGKTTSEVLTRASYDKIVRAITTEGCAIGSLEDQSIVKEPPIC